MSDQLNNITWVEDEQPAVLEVQNPVTETPVPESTGQPAAIVESAVATVPNFDDLLSKHTNGKFKGWNQVEEVISKHDLTINELNKLKDANPYANDLMRDMNAYVSKGGDPNTFMRVKSVDKDKLNPAEKVALQLQWEHNLTNEDALLKVQSDYKIGENFRVDDNERRLLDINLNIAAKQADAFISEHITKSLVPPQEKEVSERIAQFTPVVPKLADDVKTLKQSFKGTDVTLDYNYPKESVAEVTKEILETIIPEFDGLKNNEDGHKLIKEMMESRLFWKHKADILQDLANKFSLQQLKQISNPSQLADKNVPANVTDDDSMDSLVAAQRARR